jgi:hypothetical protein
MRKRAEVAIGIEIVVSEAIEENVEDVVMMKIRHDFL